MGSDREFLRESLRERIHLDHLTYLGLDESPSKISKWSQLERLVEEFLSVVPHREKFCNPEVLLVLSDAASTSNFSAYKAAAAFQCIEKYATNLLCQPWRKEYWTIQVYSGYFKHMIEGPLPMAALIFQAMGYGRTSDAGLVMREPLDPDRVARVALDCLMAVVECQMMVRLWEQNKSSSWGEVYRVRQTHVGSVEHSLRLLRLQEKPAEGILVDISNGLPNKKEGKRINIQGLTLTRCGPAQVHPHTLSLQRDDEACLYGQPSFLSPTISCWPHWDFISAYPMMVPTPLPMTPPIRDNSAHNAKAKSQKKMKADVQRRSSEASAEVMLDQCGPALNPTSATTKESKPIVTELAAAAKECASQPDQAKNEPWSCNFCTYLNAEKIEVCEMCSRSKGLKESANQLKSGGRECPQCTLVNEFKAEYCTACDVSLKDSPTYI